MSIKKNLDSYRGLDLSPGMSKADLREFERNLPGRLKEEIAELLEHTTGFKTSIIDAVDFTGRSFRFEFRDLVPHGLPIAKTLEGNFWILDVDPLGEWGNIFYFSHDPPAMVNHFDSLDSFVASVASEKKIGDEAAALARGVWEDIDSGISVEDAKRSADELVANFARGLPDNFRIFDLRGRKLRGFSWGRGRADLECKRCDAELIFAVEIPKPKQGLVAKLLGRK